MLSNFYIALSFHWIMITAKIQQSRLPDFFFLVTFFKSNKYMILAICVASLPAVADELTKVTGKLVHN